MSYLNWHVGMKVEFVSRVGRDWRPANSSKGYGNETLPKIGNVYTIRAITIFGTEVMILLNEIVNEPKSYTWPDGFVRVLEAHWDACRFRPVQTRKTSIEVFNRILLNPHIRISEDA